MFIPGTKAQGSVDPYYDASGTITSGSAPQLVRPMVPSCSHFLFQNLHASATMFLDFGAARATATLTSGAISSISVSNGGFGYTYPPIVRFAGGGVGNDTRNLGLNQPGGEGPNSAIKAGRTAKARAVLTGGVVTSIVIDDPGAGYAIAPYVFLMNETLDPYGCASPQTSSTAGGAIQLAAGQSYYVNGTRCPTDQVAVFCATAGAPFTFRWMV